MLSIVSATPSVAFPATSKYQWRGHECAYVAAGEGPPVILLHGFAGSAYNCWRSTVPAVAASGHRVYALDLLGLGKSAQPSDATYSIDTWREQVRDFCAEQLDGAPPVVIGHSFGSLVALEVAREAQQAGSPVRAVGMMNCGVGLNNKGALKVEEWRTAQQARGIATEEAAPAWQLAIFGAVLALVDLIFNQKWLLSAGLEKFATAENVRGALAEAVYMNPDRVDDALVDDYLSLAADREAAVEVLRQIYTNDSGPLPFPAAEALPESMPMLVVWGDKDNLAPSTGPVGKYLKARAGRVAATRFEELTNVGHVPQDDAPTRTNAILEEWLGGLA